jgi:hypothetical protein
MSAFAASPLALLLALAWAGSACAAPDWQQVAPDNGIFAAYADPSSLRREGDIAMMQGMYDFPRGDLTPEGMRMYSTTVRREYDCRERRVRLVSYADHAKRGGEGTVVGEARDPRRWEAVVEGSLDAAYWNIACGAGR